MGVRFWRIGCYGVVMMDKAEHIAQLIEKQIAQTITDEERAELNHWMAQDAHREDWVRRITEERFIVLEAGRFLSPDANDVWQNARLTKELRKSRRLLTFKRWLPYAAACLLAMVMVTWFYQYRTTPPSESQFVEAQDIKAGSNKAVLRFADGTTAELSPLQSGVVFDGTAISYTNGDRLLTGNATDPVADKLSASDYVTLSTPKGGQYHVVLSDGTQVWLNAASSLKHTPSFSSSVRTVELEGEAYFSVAKSRDSAGNPKPFVVKTKGQEIRVLGTEFNISAYPQAHTIKTTLVTGVVRIDPVRGEGMLLAPNEQATLSANYVLDKQTVDVSDAIAWKEGKISLNGKTIEEVMDELSRWYDLEITFEGTMPSGKFFGRANRSSNLSVVLALLENAQLSYRMEGRKLIISKQ